MCVVRPSFTSKVPSPSSTKTHRRCLLKIQFNAPQIRPLENHPKLECVMIGVEVWEINSIALGRWEYKSAQCTISMISDTVLGTTCFRILVDIFYWAHLRPKISKMNHKNLLATECWFNHRSIPRVIWWAYRGFISWARFLDLKWIVDMSTKTHIFFEIP